MKAAIHPTYVESIVTCACGNTFTTRSTKPTLRTDLCSVCHPFYTGEQRIVDTAGQVERFMRRVESAAASGARPSKRQQRIATRTADREAQARRGETPGLDLAPDGEESDAAAEPAAIDSPTQPEAVAAGVTSGSDEPTGQTS